MLSYLGKFIKLSKWAMSLCAALENWMTLNWKDTLGRHYPEKISQYDEGP